MANRFYNETFNAAIGSQARSRALDAQFVLLQTAFDLLTAEYDALVVATGNRFTSLQDCPSTLTGSAYKLPRVNAAASALEFVAPGFIRLASATATRDVVADDIGAVVIAANAAPMALTLPPNATTAIEVGSTFVVAQWDVGQVTMAPGAGVTLRSAGNLYSTRTQFSQITCIKTATDEWLLGGDLGDVVS